VPYRSVNPATGEVLKTFDQLKDDQVLSSLAAAENAFRGWAAWPFSERAKVIGTAARIMLERKEELSRSRPWKWVKGLLRVAAR
jgi:succinate-semialdehyde dehydrogenase/glutarate-semialdehyde dehydrogenase